MEKGVQAVPRNGWIHFYSRSPITGKTHTVKSGLRDLPENKEEIEKLRQIALKEHNELKQLKKRIGGRMFMKNLVDSFTEYSSILAEGTVKNRSKILTYLKKHYSMTDPVSKFINQVNLIKVINEINSDVDLEKTTKGLYVGLLFQLTDFSNSQGYTNMVVIPEELRPPRSKSNPIPFSDELLRQVLNHPWINKNVYLVAHIYVSLYQGLRPDEVMKIDPVNIDFEKRVMTLYFSKTKTTRTVPIHPAVLPVLKYLVKIRKPNKGLLRYSGDYLSDIFHKVMVQMEIRDKGFRLYGLRSTHITTAKYMSVRDDANAFWLGHSLGNTRSEHYHKETIQSATTEMCKIWFNIPNFFDVMGMESESSELKKELASLRLKVAKDMFPDVFGAIKEEDLTNNTVTEKTNEVKDEN